LPNQQEWKARGPAFTEQLLQQRRTIVWENFMIDLKMATSISVNSDFFGQGTPSSSM
jgi:hypothetical protein